MKFDGVKINELLFAIQWVIFEWLYKQIGFIGNEKEWILFFSLWNEKTIFKKIFSGEIYFIIQKKLN